MSAKKRNTIILIVLTILVIFFVILGLFIGSSNMDFVENLKAIFNQSTNSNNRIIRKIRMPRILAAFIAGAGLSVAGLIMQTTLNNDMASPGTLGVSNAAVFGANVAIIAFAGGFLSTGNNLNAYTTNINPYSTSVMAFIFSVVAILLVLFISKIRKFSPGTIALAGIAIGYVFQAMTTIMQFYATDVGLSAAVIWSFGDLGRATYKTDLIMFIVVALGVLFFMLFSWRYNALLSGDELSRSLGINVGLFRFISLLIASIITAVCVSFLGIIGFVGLIIPNLMKRIMGSDHRYLIPASALGGSVLLLFADVLSRSIGSGSALPVGAITSIIGAPFFIILILFWRKKHA